MTYDKRVVVYDFETWGLGHSAHIAQVGLSEARLGALTSPQNVHSTYIHPNPDTAISAQAVAVHGVTPQYAIANGVPEINAAIGLDRRLSEPNTLIAGYNNKGFDDHVRRHLMWRYLIEPYDCEWQGNNAVVDVYQLVQLARLYGSNKINWPTITENGVTRETLSLESLVQANGLDRNLASRSGAHDAGYDTLQTLALWDLVRKVEPQIHDLWLSYTNRATNAGLLVRDGQHMKPVLLLRRRDGDFVRPILPIGRLAGNEWVGVALDSPYLKALDRASSATIAAALRFEEGVDEPSAQTVRDALITFNTKRDILLPADFKNRQNEMVARSLSVDVTLLHANKLLAQSLDPKKLIAGATRGEAELGDNPDANLYRAGFPSDTERSEIKTALNLPEHEQWQIIQTLNRDFPRGDYERRAALRLARRTAFFPQKCRAPVPRGAYKIALGIMSKRAFIEADGPSIKHTAQPSIDFVRENKCQMPVHFDLANMTPDQVRGNLALAHVAVAAWSKSALQAFDDVQTHLRQKSLDKAIQTFENYTGNMWSECREGVKPAAHEQAPHPRQTIGVRMG